MSQQTPEPGWYPDPTGRFEHRYWSGAGWTEWVLVAGSQQVDRFWEGTRIGGEVQRSSSSHPSAAVAAGSTGAPDPGAARPSRAALRDRLARPRPHASPHAAVAAVAGVAVVIGIVALAGEVPDRTAQVLIGIVIAVVAYGLAFVGTGVSRAAGLPGALFGPPVVVAGLLGESLDGRASVAVALLVVAAIWIVMFLTPGFLGAPVLLSGSMLAAWSAIVTAIWGGSSSNPAWSIGETGRSTAILQYQDPIGSSGFPIEPGMSVVDLDGLTSATGVATLLVALGCVIAAGAVDRRGWHVLATPLIATGVILAVEGLYLASLTFAEGELLALLALGVGVALIVVGTQGARRGSVWIGATLGFVGLVGLIAESVQSRTTLGIAMLVVGAALFALATGTGRATDPLGAAPSD